MPTFRWIIKDWMGNIIHIDGMQKWSSFDDAEDILSEKLVEEYEEMRGDYDIVKKRESVNKKWDLTLFSDEELTKMIYNDESLYSIRHTTNFKDVIRNKFVFNREQEVHLDQTLTYN